MPVRVTKVDGSEETGFVQPHNSPVPVETFHATRTKGDLKHECFCASMAILFWVIVLAPIFILYGDK
jgi:hypothetical protein